RLLIRGATSALGQAAVNLAREAGARVLATTRSPDRFELLKSLGAEPRMESAHLGAELRGQFPDGVDAGVELVGNSTLVDSLSALRFRGRICLAGFLGGLAPVEGFNPLTQMPSGVQLSFFGSFNYGTPAFPFSEVPLQDIVDRAQAGTYRK